MSVGYKKRLDQQSQIVCLLRSNFSFLSPNLKTKSTRSSIMKFTVLASAFLASSALAVPTWNWNKGHEKQSHGKNEPAYFTSAYSTRAVPGAVSPAGPSNAFGHFGLRVSRDQNTVCWDIRLVNITGGYVDGDESVRLAEGAAGESGETRLFFSNPDWVRTDSTGAEVRTSSGCTSDIYGNGLDLDRLASNPSGFFFDVKTSANPSGALRGQLLPSEVEVSPPSRFTSTLKTVATASQVVNANNASVAGLPGGRATYELKLNTNENIMCYYIEVTGYDTNSAGEYFSPAKTATHTHQAAFGANGPPRLAYKNPEQVKESKGWKLFDWVKKVFGHGRESQNRFLRTSSACVKGPFTTGLLSAAGVDTGSASGFTLSQLEDNPSGFFSDFHTEKFAAGAVRGNMYRAA